MTSDKHDDIDLDLDLEMDVSGNDDVIDVDGSDAPLSAAAYGADDDYDADEDFADDDYEQPAATKKKSGGMTKVVAPLLVLLAAAAAGGYIVMNPGVLGGGAPAQVQTNQAQSDYAAVPTSETAMLPTPDLAPEMPPATELAAADVPPQPLPTLNEAPAGVLPVDPLSVNVPVEVVAEAPVLAAPAMDAPVEAPVVDASVPTIPPETVVAQPVVDVPAEVAAPVVQEDITQVRAGSDVAVVPEAMNVTAETTPVLPEVTPEVVPETPVAPPPANIVSAPTFVPAAPEGQALLPAVPAEVTNPAAPPVMNVQDIASTPVMPPPATTIPAPPSTTPTAPVAPAPMTATTGQAAAPVAASNIYYDSLAQMPTGPMASGNMKREINPALEPATKMVIVNKDKSENSEASLLVAANRALKLQRYDAALEMYDQLYAKNKRDVRIVMGRAIAQQNMGLNESAIQSYEEVLALKPDNAEALVNMMGLVRKQYPEIALRRLQEMYGRYPNNAGIAAQIGITNAGLGHYDDAMRYLGIASTLEPRNAQHLFNMAIAADRQGNKPVAIQLYERALEVDVMYGAGRSIPRESIYDRLSALRRS